MDDIKDSLKYITSYNLLILVLILFSSQFWNREYALIMVFGLMAGMINLYLRVVMLNGLFRNNSRMNSRTYYRGYWIRVIFTALAGALLFIADKYYVIVYMGGYILHFAGILKYGFKLKQL